MNEKWKEEYELIRRNSEDAVRRLNEEPRTEQDRAWQAAVRANLADSQVLNDELQQLGMPFRVGELHNVRQPYPEAIPVLLRHLGEEHNENVEASIIQALAVPYGGSGVFDALLEHLRQRYARASTDVLYDLGNALFATANRKNLTDLESIILTPEYKGSTSQTAFRCCPVERGYRGS